MEYHAKRKTTGEEQEFLLVVQMINKNLEPFATRHVKLDLTVMVQSAGLSVHPTKLVATLLALIIVNLALR